MTHRKIKKQKNMHRLYGLKILKSNHPQMRSLKRSGHVAEIHGHKVWNASYLIMDYLKKHPLPKRTRLLEIGCGWGLLSQYCAKNFNCRVHGIDADRNVLPYLQLHAEINQVRMTAEKRSFKQSTKDFLSNFDLIVGSDICFWDEMVSELFNLVVRAKKSGVKQVIIADPSRPPFHALSERCQEKFARVEVIDKRISRPVKLDGDILIVR